MNSAGGGTAMTPKRPVTIDDSFIAAWHPRYDETEHDENEYQELVPLVSVELASHSTISPDTFERILRWKSRRLLGIVKLERIAQYQAAITKCLTVAESDKLMVLVKLHGIAEPSGSTLLHFLYPNAFPIIDVRTLAVLKCAGIVDFATPTVARYAIFRDRVLQILQTCPRWTLRQLDRALFAFHKLGMKGRAS